MGGLRILVSPSLGSPHSAQHSDEIFKDRKRSSDYEEDWDVGLGWAVVEVDAANDNHTDRDHHGDAAGNGAPDGSQQQEDDLHYEVDHISRCLVRVSDSSKQRIVGRRFS